MYYCVWWLKNFWKEIGIWQSGWAKLCRHLLQLSVVSVLVLGPSCRCGIFVWHFGELLCLHFSTNRREVWHVRHNPQCSLPCLFVALIDDLSHFVCWKSTRIAVCVIFRWFWDSVFYSREQERLKNGIFDLLYVCSSNIFTYMVTAYVVFFRLQVFSAQQFYLIVNTSTR